MTAVGRRTVLAAALAAPVPAAAQLPPRPFLRLGFASLADYGVKPDDPRSDAAWALDAAAADPEVAGLYIPPGSWRFARAPRPIARPFQIVGASAVSSTLLRDYTEADPRRGLLTATRGDLFCSRLAIRAAPGSSGGCGVALVADAAGAPDNAVLEDLYVTGAAGGTWRTAVLIHGTTRREPLGVRGVYLRGCHLFASEVAACEVRGGVQIGFTGGGMFQAGGRDGRLLIGGTPEVNSHYVHGALGHLAGLHLEHCRYLNLAVAEIAGDLTATSTATDALVTGRCIGEATLRWTRSRLLDPGRN
jgi:hypothetical protein